MYGRPRELNSQIIISLLLARINKGHVMKLSKFDCISSDLVPTTMSEDSD